MKHIVILGASYGGIGTAHRILKQAPKSAAIKITLISPNTHLYWSLASPRAAIGEFKDEQVFQAIIPGFKQYGDKFEFVLGTAQGLDFNAKTVLLADGTTVAYDFLILATGTRTRDPTPFKGLGSTENTKEALHTLQHQVKEAKNIVVAGAGPTGIEFAAEVKYTFGKQVEVHLIAAGAVLSDQSSTSAQNHALKSLTALDVKLKFNTKVNGTTKLPNGQTEVQLSDGTKLLTDLYVPSFGLVPNSSYVPSNFLDSRGFVIVDEYLKVKDAGDVWAVGDIIDVEWQQWLIMEKHSTHVAKNISLILNNKAPLVYKVTARSGRIMGFSVGPKVGIGSRGNMKLPTFMITYFRKGMFTEHMGPTVSGTAF